MFFKAIQEHENNHQTNRTERDRELLEKLYEAWKELLSGSKGNINLKK